MNRNFFTVRYLVENYSLGANLSIRTAIFLLAGTMLIGIVGFVWIEGYSILDAFYMMVITISTVGYTEVQPLSENGKIFSSIIIMLNIGVFAYVLSVFTSYVIEGEIFKKLYNRRMKKKISELKDHIILCGYGRYGKEITNHFIKHQLPFVVIEINPDELNSPQKTTFPIFYIEGDATQDDVLLGAGINRAAALIAALGDDTDNVFTVLTARQLNKRLNIVSRAMNSKTGKKLKLAGASHVIMPEQIGGYYMATLITKPIAVEFFSFITNESKAAIYFEEITFDNVKDELCNKSIAQMNIRQETGASVIGFRQADGTYIVNPSPTTRLSPNSSFIVLGNNEQIENLKTYLKNDR